MMFWCCDFFFAFDVDWREQVSGWTLSSLNEEFAWGTVVIVLCNVWMQRFGSKRVKISYLWDTQVNLIKAEWQRFSGPRWLLETVIRSKVMLVADLCVKRATASHFPAFWCFLKMLRLLGKQEGHYQCKKKTKHLYLFLFKDRDL